MNLRAVYCDLDGTLLGPGASLFRDADGAFTLLGARALEACARAGAELVPYSGRRRAMLFEDARVLGVSSYAFEAGAGVVLDGETHWLTGPYQPRDGVSVHDQIAVSGAPALLLERYPGRLEYHEPWHLEREVSHLLRGRVDVGEAEALLAAHGHGDLRLVDNGAVRRRSPALQVDDPHAYHLVPRAVSKAGAIAAHMRMRGYAPEECIAIGDSREDVGAAGVVSAFYLVANAVERDPSLRAAGVRVTEARHGAGVYEAVMGELAARRS